MKIQNELTSITIIFPIDMRRRLFDLFQGCDIHIGEKEKWKCVAYIFCDLWRTTRNLILCLLGWKLYKMGWRRTSYDKITSNFNKISQSVLILFVFVCMYVPRYSWSKLLFDSCKFLYTGRYSKKWGQVRKGAMSIPYEWNNFPSKFCIPSKNCIFYPLISSSSY